MSTINALNYGDGTGTLPGSALVEAAPRAAYRYAQATPAVLSSYNVSSVSDDATGVHTVNFTSSADSDDFAYAGGCAFSSTIVTAAGMTAATTGSATVRTTTASAGNVSSATFADVAISGGAFVLEFS